MSTIVTRAGKGSALTWTEVDDNFTNLNTDKIQSGNTVSALTITTATINGGTISGITDLAVADGGTGSSTASGARTNLGLVIGTDVLAPNGSAASLTSFPTLNQNTTGSAGSVANALTIGTGLSGTSFNGSSAVTIANTGVLSNVAGTGISVSGATGNVTITNSSPMTYPGAGIPKSTGSAWDTSYTTSGSGTVVALATGAALTTPTLTEPVITGTIVEDIFALTDASTVDIDPGNGSIQTLTLTSTGRTLTFTNMVNGEAITLMVNDGTAGTITTWNATFVNNAGAAPTLSTTGYTVVSIWKVGGVVYAAVVGNA